jgi:hypothetical protein
MKTNDEEVAEIVAEITRFANAYDECDRVTATTIALAETWLKFAIAVTPQGAWKRPHASPSACQEVIVEWHNSARQVTLFIDDEGAQYVKSWGANINDEMEDGELTQDGLVGLLRWLRGDDENEAPTRS